MLIATAVGLDGGRRAPARPASTSRSSPRTAASARSAASGAAAAWPSTSSSRTSAGRASRPRRRARRCSSWARWTRRPATMTVVLGPGWPGILLHEAVGHGLEGDFNRKGTSAFAGRLGQKVASELVTVVDDGTIAEPPRLAQRGRRGHADRRATVLIENGILRGYMQDRLNARLMGMAATGNGRRESYAHPPMPRMTNTFMLAGQDDPEEIIRSVQRGLYAVNFGGGQVDITSGKFVFSASEAYLIEDGRVTAPVKGATLIGNGPDALTRVIARRSRPEARRGRGHLRQGRPVGAGRRGAADDPHRRHDGRRDPGVSDGALRTGSLADVLRRAQAPGGHRRRRVRGRRAVTSRPRCVWGRWIPSSTRASSDCRCACSPAVPRRRRRPPISPASRWSGWWTRRARWRG